MSIGDTVSPGLASVAVPVTGGVQARGDRRARSKLAVMGNPINLSDTRPTVQAVRNQRALRRQVVSSLILVLVVSAAACSDDDTSAIADDETSTTVATTTTTQPPATDETSHEIVEDLVLEATDLADELFQDPTVVADPDNEAIARLREIYTDDSPTPDGVEDQLRDLVAMGQHQRPTSNGLFREVSLYAFEAVDADTLTFDTCNQIDTETVDATGRVVETEALVVFVGGSARRIDGVWRFHGLSNDISRSNPITPGGSEPGLCAQLATERAEP